MRKFSTRGGLCCPTSSRCKSQPRKKREYGRSASGAASAPLQHRPPTRVEEMLDGWLRGEYTPQYESGRSHSAEPLDTYAMRSSTPTPIDPCPEVFPMGIRIGSTVASGAFVSSASSRCTSPSSLYDSRLGTPCNQRHRALSPSFRGCRSAALFPDSSPEPFRTTTAPPGPTKQLQGEMMRGSLGLVRQFGLSLSSGPVVPTSPERRRIMTTPTLRESRNRRKIWRNLRTFEDVSQECPLISRSIFSRDSRSLGPKQKPLTKSSSSRLLRRTRSEPPFHASCGLAGRPQLLFPTAEAPKIGENENVEEANDAVDANDAEEALPPSPPDERTSVPCDDPPRKKSGDVSPSFQSSFSLDFRNKEAGLKESTRFACRVAPRVPPPSTQPSGNHTCRKKSIGEKHASKGDLGDPPRYTKVSSHSRRQRMCVMGHHPGAPKSAEPSGAPPPPPPGHKPFTHTPRVAEAQDAPPPDSGSEDDHIAEISRRIVHAIQLQRIAPIGSPASGNILADPQKIVARSHPPKCDAFVPPHEIPVSMVPTVELRRRAFDFAGSFMTQTTTKPFSKCETKYLSQLGKRNFQASECQDFPRQQLLEEMFHQLRYYIKKKSRRRKGRRRMGRNSTSVTKQRSGKSFWGTLDAQKQITNTAKVNTPENSLDETLETALRSFNDEVQKRGNLNPS